MKSFQLETSDLYPIAVTSFGENNSTHQIIVISSAIGVPQKFYAKFATYLANKGYLVFTYDYRGIGQSKPQSLKGFNAEFIDWADKDFMAISQYIEEMYPKHQKYLIGHSMGGIMLGLSRAFRVYDKFVTIGSQFGYIENFHDKDKFKIKTFFKVMIPLLTPLYGYFPSPKVNMGDPLPKGIAYNWKSIILGQESILGYANKTQNFYEEITQPMLIISLDDDYMAPPKTVDLFASKVMVNAKKKRLNIKPQDVGLKNIGHMDFFREKNKNELWPIPLDFIES